MDAMNIRLRKSEVSIWKRAYKNLNNALNAIAVEMHMGLGAARVVKVRIVIDRLE